MKMFSIEQRGSIAVVLQSMQHEKNESLEFLQNILCQQDSIKKYTEEWKIFELQVQNW